ncbi:MAG: peptidylprolyl isomerase [Bacteroidetes bacterium]|nr:MAG: peptidylprolyl isomerase [Bacteroidota bacterium]
MKNILLILSLGLAMYQCKPAREIPTTVAEPVKEEQALMLQNFADSMSFYIGIAMGHDMATAPFEVNNNLFTEGFLSVSQDSAAISKEEARAVISSLQDELKRLTLEAEKAKAAKANAENKAFLNENGSRDGVLTTSSGLQYEVLVKGDGPMPADTSRVKVHYEGSLLNGQVFDSSFERGEPITFGLKQVIQGWTEGLQLMPVGSTYRFWIPPDLGYGSRAQGDIPANSILVFRVELLGLE